MAKKIDSKSKRNRLAKRNEPYWDKVVWGGYVGYRVGEKEGVWKARYRIDNGEQKYKTLVLPPHLPVNEYDAAVSEAKKWFDSIQAGNQARPGSVGEAATDYLEYLRVEKGMDAVADARGRINRCILPPFDKKPLDKLTTADIQKWLHAFVPISGSAKEIQQAKNSANRNLNTFKAILNWAHKNGLVASDSAWSRVTRFKGVNAARQEFLTSEQVRNLISKTEGYFQDLVKAGALTGARYGELAQLKVKDIDAKAGVLNIQVGKTGPRIVPLTDNMQAFFNLMAKDKLPEAPLLTKDGVHQWGHSDQDKLMKQAVKAAKLHDDVVFYTLRHSYIANAISARMDIYSIAEITGTSISMIEKHYGKLLKDRVREQMTKAALIDLTS